MRGGWRLADLVAASLEPSPERARECAAAGVREALRDSSREDQGAFGRRVQESISARLEATFGPLSGGWCWARDEGSIGGGVVSAWCCPRHSIPSRSHGRLSDEQIDAVAKAAADGLEEWWRFLARAGLKIFALDPPTDLRSTHRAVAELSGLVAEATGCGDAWYNLAAIVLGWYFELHGLPKPRELAAKAISGRFESWVSPSDEVVVAVAHVLVDEFEYAERERRADVDALELHVALELMWFDEPEDVYARHLALAPIAGDFDHLAPHREAIERFDQSRSTERGRAMTRALEATVEHAASEAPFTLEFLAEIHALAMDRSAPSPVRTRSAFAKGGAERYGMLGREQLEVPAWELGLLPCTECARFYLDLCFFHPWDDGNARAARLAVAWLDVRHRIGFAGLIPIFATPRAAGDAASYWALVRGLLTAAEHARRLR